jgi:hypothetical protein
VKLTETEQRRVAQGANWYFDVYFGMNTGDSVVFTGDGVDDLDRLIEILSTGTFGSTARYMCDVTFGNYSNYRPFDLEDLRAIRNYFIGWYGTVAKPDAYEPRTSVAYPQQNVEVTV